MNHNIMHVFMTT